MSIGLQFNMENFLFTRRSTTELFAEVLGEAKYDLGLSAYTMMENVVNIVERINAYASFMPKQARWQAEYMMNKLVQSEDVATGFADFSKIAQSTERVVDIVEQIVSIAEQTPELIGNERISLMREMDRQRIATMAQLTNERIAVLEMIQEERITVIEALREERIATMKT